jgi:pimeloyl-ACP methyl ester carboxylesterase
MRIEDRAMVKSIALPTGITLQFAEQGLASGIPVVFLHGFADSWRSFEPVLARLPSTIRAFALTQRGHGGSGKPTDGYRYTDFAADVRGLLDALQLPAAVIVGHSMGSMVAQRLAADHPERVAGLVLLGTFRTLHRDATLQELWDSALVTLADPVDRAFLREFQLSTLARAIPPELLATVVEESRAVPARVWRAAFRGFLDTPDFSGELARLRAPTLIAWGDRDQYGKAADQQALRAVIPGARLIVHRGGGHALHWEDPVRVTDELVAFLYERRDSRQVVTHAHESGQHRPAARSAG